ncbi:hypothetical protein HYX58_05145 [Candidatus Dependentiae bacterium]|nr:hypothetical protein [Candidatus Dependentiae bacterium]
MFNLLCLFFIVPFYVIGMDELPSIETTKNQIMSNEYLKNHEIIRKKVFQEIDDLGLTKEEKYTERIALLEKYKKKHPLIALSECASSQMGVCPLSRAIHPNYRDTYENTVSQELARQLKNQKTISIASFGCGQLLSDAIIYTKALETTKSAELIIHQIDHQLIIPQLYLNKTEENRRVKRQTFSSEETLSSIQKTLESTKNEFSENSEEKALASDSLALKNTILDELHTQSFLHNSLLDYLQEAFPQTTISMYVHGTAQDYLQDIENKKFPKPNMAIAADIDDGYGMERNSVADYYLVRSKALENDNSAAYILARSTENPDTQAQIRCIKMENGQRIEASMKKL